jgi:hypothetical protein
LDAFLKIKFYIMKKLIVLLAFAGFITACNDSAQKDSSATDTAATPEVTTPAASDTTAAPTTQAVKDSVMQLKDGKVVISIGGSWTPIAAAVTTSNGRKVSPTGEVSKNGKTRKLEEGMMIDKDGQIMDKDGKAVDNTGWE